MELKDWILGNIEIFKTVYVPASPWVIENEEDYNTLLEELGGQAFYSVNTHRDSYTYYFLWDELGYYTARVEGGGTGWDALHYVWGLPKWRSLLGDLIKDCVGCSCYNDKIVTGWCRAANDISIYPGFIGELGSFNVGLL